MEINYNILDKILMDFAGLQDGQISFQCEEEIKSFVQGHDFGVFSAESREQLKYAFFGFIRDVYEAQTGQILPNIFAREEE